MSRKIPPELDNLSDMMVLTLSGAQLTGCVPRSVGDGLDMERSDLGGLSICVN